MGVPQAGFLKGKLQSPLFCQVKAVGDLHIIRFQAQQARDQSLVGAVALAGLGKGAVQSDLCPHRLAVQQRPGHAADAHRPSRMRTGRPYRHRA